MGDIGTSGRCCSRLTGNDISGHYFRHYFGTSVGDAAIFTIFFFLRFLLRRDLFSSKECLDQKTYFANVDQSAQEPRIGPLSRPRRPFCGPLAAIMDFAGGSMFLIEGVIRSKNLFSESGSKWPIT